MAAMTSKFYYVCVIQYYTDQWSTHSISIISMSVLSAIKAKTVQITWSRWYSQPYFGSILMNWLSLLA